MNNLWRAFKLILPHRWMLALYLTSALLLALVGSAPLVLGRTFISHLQALDKKPAWPRNLTPEQKVALEILQKQKEAEEAKSKEADAIKNPFKHWLRSQVDFESWLKARYGTGADYLLALCVLISIFWALKAFFDFLNNYLAAWLSQRLRSEAIERVMAKLLSLDIPYFDKQSNGDLVTRMVSDGDNLRKTVKLFLDFCQQPPALIVLICVAIYYDWKLFLYGIIGVPFLIIPITYIIRKITRHTKTYWEKTSDIAQEMLQNLNGIRVIHAYNAEAAEAQNFRKLSQSLFRTGMKRSWNRAIQRPLTSVLMGLGGVAVMYFGGKEVIENPKREVADFLVFIGAMAMLYEPFSALLQSLGEIAEYLPNAERIFQILDVKPGISDAPDAKPCPKLQNEIVFENVSFSYGGAMVLKDFNLRLRMGEKLGIVGRTGVGKSTLLSLLLRYYDPTSGRITIDGVDIRTVTLASLRAQIALVTQQAFLFQTTVEENIRYGRPGATKEDIIEAAKTAMVHDEIMAKPLGYQELCGERGGELNSGGQNQRLTIARALLRNAPILLLDEATSSLDAVKERDLQQAFDKLEANRTCLIVAHRLSTLNNVDRILVFAKEGGVEAIGTIPELLETSPTFKEMWAQSGNK